MSSGHTRTPTEDPSSPSGPARRLSVTFLSFSGVMTLLASNVLAGVGDARSSLILSLFGFSGYAALYFLLERLPPDRQRSGRLVFAQLVFHIALISLCYTLIEASRGLALQLLCLVVVFDARRLPWRLTLAAAALSILLPTLGMSLRWTLLGPDPDQNLHLMFLALGSVATPVVLMAWLESQELRRRKRAQRDGLASALQKLHMLSLHDSLTGVYNREHIQSLLATQLQRLERGDGPSCLALLDLDHFKLVNDQHGHAVGDAVLQGFTRCVQDSLQGTPHQLGRWGGEEFLLLLPDSDMREATAVLLKMQRALRLYDWSHCAPGLGVTVSAGALQLEGGLSAGQAVDAADRALYRAKAEGRNRCHWATTAQPPLQPATARRDASRALPHPVTALTAADRSDRQAPTRVHGRWSSLILGTDPGMRRALRLCLVVSGIYLTLILSNLLQWVTPDIWPPGTRHAFLTLQWLGALVPYALVRSGLTQKSGDRSLVVPQMIWASAQLVVCFVLLPDARAYCLQMLCVTLVFGFIDLKPREAVFAGVCTIAMLVLGHLALALHSPPGLDLLLLTLQMVGSVAVLSLLTWLSRDYAQMRVQLDVEAADLAAARDRVTAALSVDPMTALHNRQHMQKLLSQACERHARSGRSFCIALIDLDHFKAVNDSHGHNAGDEVLVAFAHTALELGRATDVLGRWGGEEFLLLSEAETAEPSLRYLERLRRVLGRTTPVQSLPGLRISYSAGLACHASGEALDQLLERADRALYAAKAQGRGICVVAEEAGFTPPSRRPAAAPPQDTHSGGRLA